ncbi:MAG TPA: amino acid ABC transporter substrate-binding protein, partial [Ruminiclostridium sp.]|nr:amino acid ABC transporter substrate-binding protein [Ruminiclostridium sp.]
MKKTLSIMLAMLLLLGVLAGCSKTSSPSASTPAAGSESGGQAAEPSTAAFKIGGTGPLTGGAAI